MPRHRKNYLQHKQYGAVFAFRKAEQLLNLPENTANEEMAIVIRSYLLHNLIMQ
mgnify:CR=1 FL=1